MRLIKMIAAIVVSGVLATNTWAADYTVKRTLQLTEDKANIWRAVGGFCDVDDWHPGVLECEERVIDGKLHRVLTTTGGDTYVEQRIAKEKGLSYTYRTTESPLLVENLTATFSIVPGDGATLSWSVNFSSDDPAMEAKVIEIIEMGLSGIGTTFGRD